MILLKTHIVENVKIPIRLQEYLTEAFPELATRSSAKKAIKKGAVLADGVKASSGLWVKPGMKLELYDPELTPPKPLPMKLEVVFEDDFLAVVNKPAGISVSGNKYVTIQNALMHNLKTSTAPNALDWPKPVHRLDFLTSGLLLIAKTKNVIVELGKQFANKSIKKQYRAIVSGKLPHSGEIETPVNGQTAKTIFNSIEYVPSPMTGWITKVDLFPETGRTHQLRIHMASLGNPVVGDSKYTINQPLLKGKGLFLAAIGIEFTHPETQKLMRFEMDEPSKFDALVRKERKNYKK